MSDTIKLFRKWDSIIVYPVMKLQPHSATPHHEYHKPSLTVLQGCVWCRWNMPQTTHNSADEGLKLDTSASQYSYSGYLTLINSCNSKFSSSSMRNSCFFLPLCGGTCLQQSSTLFVRVATASLLQCLDVLCARCHTRRCLPSGLSVLA